jgi:hypothetical protein
MNPQAFIRGGAFVSIDPGKDHFAWARFGKLEPYSVAPGAFVACGVERWTSHLAMLGAFDRVFRGVGDIAVIERMRIYPGARAEDPNDLIDVTLTAGAISARFPFVLHVTASAWKGQAPKEVTVHRVIEALGGDPCAGLNRSDRGHAYDAVAIGLWARGLYR